MTRTKQKVISRREYVPHREQSELKVGICREEGVLTNFHKFHEDRTTSTIFSQHCRKTYRTDLVCPIQYTLFSLSTVVDEFYPFSSHSLHTPLSYTTTTIQCISTLTTLLSIGIHFLSGARIYA